MSRSVPLTPFRRVSATGTVTQGSSLLVKLLVVPLARSAPSTYNSTPPSVPGVGTLRPSTPRRILGGTRENSDYSRY